MQLSSPAPTGITVNISSAVDPGAQFGKLRAERLTLDFRPDAAVEASVNVFDPLWDGPYPEPPSPEDWHARRSSSHSPALDEAVGVLQARAGALDLARIERGETERGDYATFHLQYAERPTNIHPSLRPLENQDGSWTVYLRTSINDLFANPSLTPLVDAARAVIAAAR